MYRSERFQSRRPGRKSSKMCDFTLFDYAAFKLTPIILIDDEFQNKKIHDQSWMISA
jgi:hypothetical protein